jgi:hypothetical protein
MRSACSYPWQDSNLQPPVEIHARGWREGTATHRADACPMPNRRSGAGGPFAAQDAIEQVVGPLALGPGALQEVAFAAHAHPLQHRGRAGVAIVAGCPDPMLALLDEQVVQQPADRLGRVAVALVLGREGEADLGQTSSWPATAAPTTTSTAGRGSLEGPQVSRRPGRRHGTWPVPVGGSGWSRCGTWSSALAGSTRCCHCWRRPWTPSSASAGPTARRLRR